MDLRVNDKVVIKSGLDEEIMGTIVNIEYIDTKRGRLPRKIVIMDVTGRYHEYMDNNNRFSYIEKGRF